MSDLDGLLRQLSPEQVGDLDRETKELLLAHLTARDARLRQIPLAAWTPHAKQERFIRSTARIRVLLGGNRSGKTWVGTAEALAHALGYRPWQVPDLALTNTEPRDFPARSAVPESAWVRRADGLPIEIPNRGIIVSGQGLQRGIGTTIWPRIQELWPREVKLRSWHGQQGTPLKIELTNGSLIFLASADQDRLTFEGSEFHWADCDEPCAAFVFNGIWRGLTQSLGSIWFTQTPLGAEARWLHTAFIATHNELAEVFAVGIRDNPYLDRSAIEAFENTTTWSDEEREARLHGRFEFLSDTVWPTFRHSHHVVDPFPIPSNWLRGCTIDPHLRKPWFIGWWAVSPTGHKVFYREWPTGEFRRMRSSNLAPADYVRIIREAEGKDRITFRYLDPNFGRSPTVASKKGMRTLQAELAEYGLEFSCKINDDIQYGVAAVADALRCDPNLPPVADNQPRLSFMSSCRNLISAVENFCYLPIKSEVRQHELYSDEFKDGADTVRYTIVAPAIACGDSWSYLEGSFNDDA